MSHSSEFDSPFCRREVIGVGAVRDAGPTLPLPNGLLNDRFVVEPFCGFRDTHSVRSLGALSPFYRSRPASPISERDPVAWGLNLAMQESLSPAKSVSDSRAGTAATGRSLPPLCQQTLSAAGPSSWSGPRMDAGVQTVDLLLRFPRTGYSRRRIAKKPRRKTKSLEIPREEALFELAEPKKTPQTPRDPHLAAKIKKVRAFWTSASRALPTTFRLGFLCPLKKQSEFMDFSLKEIMVEENGAHDILLKPSPADDSVSHNGSIKSPWADDFEQAA